MLQVDKKIITIIIASLAILIILVLLYFAFRNANSQPPDTSSKTISITTKDNKTISVNNFYLNPVEESEGAITINRTTDLATYFYNEVGNKFTITLNEGTYDEFAAKKPQAEQEFLNILGITETQACSLNVEVRNGGSFDPDLQGRVFYLSFCS